MVSAYKRVTVQERIINTSTVVTFEISEYDLVHYLYAQGVITETEAVKRLDGHRPDHNTIQRMTKLIKHFA